MRATVVTKLERQDAEILTRDNIELAIDLVEDSRQTHVLWRQHLRRGRPLPSDEVGDLAHHEEAIRGYDYVLRVLRAVRRRWDSDGRLR